MRITFASALVFAGMCTVAACGQSLDEPPNANGGPTNGPDDQSEDGGAGFGTEGGTDRDGGITRVDGGDSEGGVVRPPIVRTRFALIGDYGVDDASESAVAQLVIAEAPDFVVTLGDNNYPDGLASTIDANIGKYYHSFIAPYKGSFGAGASVNRFWPCLGNHDWNTGTMQPYADFFELPGNERYWDLVRNDVQFFCLDSDPHEPDGRTPASTQGQWLTNAMSASSATFKLVVMHHPPYSSGEHGSTTTMQWPYASYGADAVLAGHDHTYERLEANGIPYLVQGSGGAALYAINTTLAESVFSYNASHGATLARSDGHFVVFESLTTSNELIDLFSVPARKDQSATRRTLVSAGSVWSYDDDGTVPANWADPAYDASAWKSGPASLGYGQTGLKTTVGYGGNASQKLITTYFRRTFDLQRVDDIAWLALKLQKDDGAIVYVNGTEVHRTNMPAGAVTSQTTARHRVGYVAEEAWEPAAIDGSVVHVGTNVLAVELHQSAPNTSDAVFDLSLEAVSP